MGFKKIYRSGIALTIGALPIVTTVACSKNVKKEEPNVFPSLKGEISLSKFYFDVEAYEKKNNLVNKYIKKVYLESETLFSRENMLYLKYFKIHPSFKNIPQITKNWWYYLRDINYEGANFTKENTPFNRKLGYAPKGEKVFISIRNSFFKGVDFSEMTNIMWLWDRAGSEPDEWQFVGSKVSDNSIRRMASETSKYTYEHMKEALKNRAPGMNIYG